MKITKEQLDQIIKEEKGKIESEKKYAKAMFKVFAGIMVWLIIMILISLK